MAFTLNAIIRRFLLLRLVASLIIPIPLPLSFRLSSAVLAFCLSSFRGTPGSLPLGLRPYVRMGAGIKIPIKPDLCTGLVGVRLLTGSRTLQFACGCLLGFLLSNEHQAMYIPTTHTKIHCTATSNHHHLPYLLEALRTSMSNQRLLRGRF